MVLEALVVVLHLILEGVWGVLHTRSRCLLFILVYGFLQRDTVM